MREWLQNASSHRRDKSATDRRPNPLMKNADVEPKDWNKAWQEALEIPLTTKNSNRWERLARLSADFKVYINLSRLS
jgi:hypothetical protein